MTRQLKIYGKPNCGGCVTAKHLLDEAGVEYQYIDITEDPEAYKFIVGEGHRSIPQIYDGSEYVGDHKTLPEIIN